MKMQNLHHLPDCVCVARSGGVVHQIYKVKLYILKDLAHTTPFSLPLRDTAPLKQARTGRADCLKRITVSFGSNHCHHSANTAYHRAECSAEEVFHVNARTN